MKNLVAEMHVSAEKRHFCYIYGFQKMASAIFVFCGMLFNTGMVMHITFKCYRILVPLREKLLYKFTYLHCII
jgi:hypothetical protein